jgi:hypothetical protein
MGVVDDGQLEHFDAVLGSMDRLGKKMKKEKHMEFRTEDVGGTEYLIADNGAGDIHQIDLRAIGSWGLLLGLTDTAEIVSAILRFKEPEAAPGQPNAWTPMFDALNDGLDAMSAAGVPPEHMEDLLDPELGSPVPGPELCGKLQEAQAHGRAKVAESPDDWGDNRQAVAELLAGHEEVIAEERLKLVDRLAPVYEIPPPPPPSSVPEAVDLLNWRDLGTLPDSLKP